jgi:hypothetical protein
MRALPGFLVTLCIVSGLLNAAVWGAETPARPATVEQVIVTFKTHFDIGYTDMAANVVQRYRTTMIDQALRVCDESRDLPAEQQFVWTIPGWPMTKILEDWDGQTPTRKTRIMDAFKQGRFVVHALPFTTHTELLEIEDLVYGMGFSSRLSRSAGLALPRDAKMTDVPCHTWLMSTLLRHAGVDFLHLGCNAASSSPDVPPLFWWEGPDGSRLLTMYAASGYGSGLAPPKDWPYKTWLALIHTGDNHGPPTPEEVKKLLADAKATLPGVRVRIGRLSDFAEAILAEKADLPVIRGDMPDTWIHGPMCDPAGAQIARNIRPLIAAMPALNTLLQTWGVPVADASDAVAAAHEQSLLYGEHTWGGAQYWITKYGPTTNFTYGDAWKKDRQGGRFERLEASWEEHTNYIETARDRIMPVAADNLRALAHAVNVAGPRVVVYNPLPWKRDGVVRMHDERRTFFVAMPADGRGEASPISGVDGAPGFLAQDVPPLGYRTYRLEAGKSQPPKARVDRQSLTVENEFFKATLDPVRGTVRSLIDKSSGRELVETTAAHGFGQYLYERFDADQTKAFVAAYGKIQAPWFQNEFGKPLLPPAKDVPYRAVSPTNFSIRFEENAVSCAAIMEAAAGNCPHAVTTRLVLYADRPHVDLEITLHDKRADPWPEAGWLCLPIKADDPQFRAERVGSIIDPTRDIISGANRHILAINGGLAVTDSEGRGVGLCPLDHPLVSLDAPGCWKYSRDFVPRKPNVYVNLFNNQWTTNFRFWNEGTWTSRVRVWAIDAYEAESSLVTPSYEGRFPLMAAVADTAAGPLPASRAGIELSRGGVQVVYFGQNPDGEGMVLRLWELAGQSGPCEVRLPDNLRPTQLQPVNLRGESVGEPIAVRDGRFTVPLRGFAPVAVQFP